MLKHSAVFIYTCNGSLGIFGKTKGSEQKKSVPTLKSLIG
jgi:hypothetical protein